ncbi:MAG: saccharopine dehydrogenase NADP-binding domain-containing protein [Bacteroidetes bacterium]|nr:saccharopine dehydrogenase NADP-binding domain-containing protein [Bacteroidota bacterium]MBS1539811.1 saccharopine dehydrogenase NADP-binding domain-containing protein [Bacteroidota bacterium]
MKNILVLGAGRSSSALISYFIKNAPANDWHLTVGDFSLQAAKEKTQHSTAKAIEFNIENTENSRSVIRQADVVVSLVPASLHPKVAAVCLQEGKHLITASYVSDEMKSFDTEAKAKGLLFLNESGLDPGIDHMSAMQVINRIKQEGGEVYSFESFTGGLIAPSTDPDNPWRYKFTWNPRNVVVAGQGTAKFLQDGLFKYIPYQQLFTRTTPVLVPGLGEYDGYANRDSLKYVEVYGLQQCKTIVRGTLRNHGYCQAWNLLVQLGCCDDTFMMEGIDKLTHRGFIASFLGTDKNVEDEIANRFGVARQGEEMRRLSWSGFFSDEKVGLAHATPAQALEHILNKKWKLNPGDKDLIVMWHRFRFLHNGKMSETQAWLTATGEDETHTAMAKTVGLPLAIATKLLLQNKIRSRGVLIPVTDEFYNPILKELNQLGVELRETTVPAGN